MAAPCFFATNVLLADLETLGYPHAADAASVSPNGKSRLETLAWLACRIDTDFKGTSEDALAAFWDRLGIHCADRNKNGHRIPLTVSGDKQRERFAASVYMRVAIDLVMAFERRRVARGDSESTKPVAEVGEGEEPLSVDEEPPFDAEDIEANTQLETLIMNRHLLFPNTVQLSEQQPTGKRRPLTVRKANGQSRAPAGRSTMSNSKPVVRKQAAAFGKAQPARDEVLQRLKAIQRETQNLQRATTRAEDIRANSDGLKREPDGNFGQSQSTVSEAEVQKIADASAELKTLVDDFEALSTEALTFRRERPDLLRPDSDEDEKISEVSADCWKLENEVQTILLAARDMQTSISNLVEGQNMVETLANSSTIKDVAEYGERIERHM